MINQNINQASTLRRDVNLMIWDKSFLHDRTDYRDGEYNVLSYRIDTNGNSVSLQNS